MKVTLITLAIICIVEFLAIILVTPLAKPKLWLKFFPKDVYEAGKNHPEPPVYKQILGYIVVGIFCEGLDIELISLNDMREEIPYVSENGNTPLENAAQKAHAYYKAFKIPVFSCDSGLYFENLPEFSPMVHVRNVGGKCLTDEEMTEYYGGLAAKYGDIIARYKNAVCFVYDENNVFTDESDDLCGNRFIITSKPHPKREAGFPLDRLSKRIDGGGYYYDNPEPLVGAMASGFKRFFSESLNIVSVTEHIN